MHWVLLIQLDMPCGNMMIFNHLSDNAVPVYNRKSGLSKLDIQGTQAVIFLWKKIAYEFYEEKFYYDHSTKQNVKDTIVHK